MVSDPRILNENKLCLKQLISTFFIFRSIVFLPNDVHAWRAFEWTSTLPQRELIIPIHD